jgi:hypothetical protein
MRGTLAATIVALAVPATAFAQTTHRKEAAQ